MDRLWNSDESSPLTHEAAREIERLEWVVQRLTGDLLAATKKILELESRDGFRLTDAEAHLVHKLASDAIERATDDTVLDMIGDADAIATAAQLYMRLADAMQEGRFL